MKEITKTKNTAFKGKLLTVETKDVILEDGTLSYREVALKKSGVVIIPLKDNYLYFVKQYRSGIEQETLEFPAGSLEEKEDYLTCAHRELQEEINFDFRKGTIIGTFAASPAWTNEMNTFVLAEELFESKLNKDFDERIDIIKLTIQEVEELINSNQINDLRTMMGIQYIFNYLKNSGKTTL